MELFERMIKSARASLTYDELLTLVTEVEAVLNLLNQDHSLTFPQMTPKSLSLRLTYWLATEFYLYQIQPFLKIQITTSLLNDLNRRMKHLTETSRNVGKGNIYRELHRTYKASKGIQDTVKGAGPCILSQLERLSIDSFTLAFQLWCIAWVSLTETEFTDGLESGGLVHYLGGCMVRCVLKVCFDMSKHLTTRQDSDRYKIYMWQALRKGGTRRKKFFLILRVQLFWYLKSGYTL